MRSEMARRSRQINLWIWIALTVLSGGSLTGLLPFDIFSLFKSLPSQQASNSSDSGSSGMRDSGVSTTFDSGRMSSSSAPAGDFVSERPLLIASFNIQVLGQSKMSKSDVVQRLAEIIRRFDLIAIQEVRSKEDDVLPRLIQAANATGRNFSFLIGPRLGRTVSKEQYAFVFDTDRIEYDPSSIGTISDPDDQLHREPFVTRFRAKTRDTTSAFTFWMVNTHTDPDEVPQELNALTDVFRVMQSNRTDEDDVILLGDLNASPSQFGPLRSIPYLSWSVEGVPTNTRRTKTYDNLLFSSAKTTEYTGRWGVFDMERELGITAAEALRVSDHMPVWAEFSQWESGALVQ